MRAGDVTRFGYKLRYKFYSLMKAGDFISESYKKDTVSKSWFVTFNYPADHGYPGEPQDVVERVLDDWMSICPSGSCAASYCISSSGMPHLHLVLEDVKAMRFSFLKNNYSPCKDGGSHIEPTKGSKEQAEDYMKKRGKFSEKGETVVYTSQRGEIRANRGKRRDLEIIGDMLDSGSTPSQILSQNIAFRQYEDIIKSAFFDKKRQSTPFIRSVKVFYHVGLSGSGKSYTAQKLMEKHGEQNVFFVSQYANGFLDSYCAEPILFLDELRGSSIKYSDLLSMLDEHKTTFYARYHNIYGLWTEVHITSILPPEKLYGSLVENNKEFDTLRQLLRRITFIVYHWHDTSGYHEFSCPGDAYVNYDTLISTAKSDRNDGFIPVSNSVFSDSDNSFKD